MSLNIDSAYKGSYWFMFIDTDDGNKVKATDGVTIFQHISDAGNVLMSIFDAMGSNSFVIEVFDGDFQIKSWDETKTRKSNFSIKGQGSGITNFVITNDLQNVAGKNRAFAFEANASTFSANLLAASVNINSSTVTVSTNNGLVAGAYVILYSEALWEAGLSGVAKKGESNRIVAITGSGAGPFTVTLEKWTRDSYSTANSASLRRVDFLQNIHLRGFTIKAAPDYTNQNIFMRFDFCDNLQIHDVKLKDFAGNFHVALVNNTVINSKVQMEFEISPEKGDFTESGPYAISCRAACENIRYLYPIMKGGIRHAFTTTANNEMAKNGVPRNIHIINGNADTTGECSWESHGEGDGIYYEGCSVHSSRPPNGVSSADDADAFGVRCKNVHIINPKVYNCIGNAIGVSGKSYGVHISGGFIRNSRRAGTSKGIAIQIDNGAHDVKIDDIDIENTEGHALNFEGNNSNIQVDNIKIKTTSTANMSRPSVHAGQNVVDVQLSNIVVDPGNLAIIPIQSEPGSDRWTLDAVDVSKSGKDILLSGVDNRWNHLSCKGRNLERPQKKIGRVEGSGGSNSCTGLFEGQTSDASGNKRIESMSGDGLHREYATSTLNAVAGIKSNTYCERSLNPYIRFVFRLEDTTGKRFFAGWNSSESLPAGPATDPLVNRKGIMVKLASNGTHFVIYHNSGDANTTTGANIAAVDTNRHVFELRADNANSKFQYRWDYGNWNDIITDIPGPGDDLAMQLFEVNTVGGAAKVTNMLEIHTEIPNA